MPKPRITRFELELLEQLWKLGPASVREIQESLPEKDRPAYTTVQTIVYRLEEKKAVRRVKTSSAAPRPSWPIWSIPAKSRSPTCAPRSTP